MCHKNDHPSFDQASQQQIRAIALLNLPLSLCLCLSLYIYIALSFSQSPKIYKTHTHRHRNKRETKLTDLSTANKCNSSLISASLSLQAQQATKTYTQPQILKKTTGALPPAGSMARGGSLTSEKSCEVDRNYHSPHLQSTPLEEHLRGPTRTATHPEQKIQQNTTKNNGAWPANRGTSGNKMHPPKAHSRTRTDSPTPYDSIQ